MPAPNPIRKVTTATVPRRMADDMQYRNSLLMQKEVITSISRKFNPRSSFSLFFDMLGSIQGTERAVKPGGEAAMARLEAKSIGSEYIHNRTIRDTYVPARVLDASRVPDRLVAGKTGSNVVVTFDKFVGETGTILLLRDKKTTIMVVSFRGLPDSTVEYTIQLNAIAGITASGSLLSQDSPVNYGMGNSMPELSPGPNSMITDGSVYTDVIQPLQIIRLGSIQSGSAAADTTIQLTVLEGQDGSKVEQTYMTDLAPSTARAVCRQLDRLLLHSQPNVSANNREIANRIEGGRFTERPTFAGLYYFWDLAPWKWYAYKSAGATDGVKLLNSMLTFMRGEVGTQGDYVAFCQGAGREWLKDVFEAAVLLKNYHIELVVDANHKLGGGTIGFDIDTYYTRNGKITIIDMDASERGWGQFDRTSYDGNSFDIRSNRIYLSPVTKTDGNGVTTLNGKLFFKEKDEVNRLFAMAVTRGHTGRNNNMNAQQIASATDEAFKKMANDNRYSVDSTVDGDEISILSQIAPFWDTDQMMYIELLP